MSTIYKTISLLFQAFTFTLKQFLYKQSFEIDRNCWHKPDVQESRSNDVIAQALERMWFKVGWTRICSWRTKSQFCPLGKCFLILNRSSTYLNNNLKFCATENIHRSQSSRKTIVSVLSLISHMHPGLLKLLFFVFADWKSLYFAAVELTKSSNPQSKKKRNTTRRCEL